MAYYVRKISRAKWQNEPLNDDPEVAAYEVRQISSDAITNCIKTTQKKLSLWKVEEKSGNIEDIIPLILGFEKPDRCDIVYIDEEDLNHEGIVIEQSMEDANVPIDALKINHYNAIVNNYEELGKFGKVVLKSLDSHKRFQARNVKDKLKSMIETAEIEAGDINPKLYEKLYPPITA